MRIRCNLSQSTVFYQNINATTISSSTAITRVGRANCHNSIYLVLFRISRSSRSVNMSRVCLLTIAALLACARAYEGERHTLYISRWLSYLIHCFACS